jgi:type II secretory pathway pseudopilin PulG
MTRRIETALRAGRRPGRGGGFTLVELLVVIGIIILLGSILLPMAVSSRRAAVAMRMKSDLNVIGMGLEEYKKVFKDYPRGNGTGARQLVTYLIGDKGEGVRDKQTTGGSPTKGAKKWGPFISPDKFTIRGDQLQDANGIEIQYYPRYNLYDRRTGRVASPNKADGYILGDVNGAGTLPKAMFSRGDGLARTVTGTGGSVERDHLEHMLFMLGERDDSSASKKPNNAIEDEEQLKFNGAFILVGAGPNGKWGRIDEGTGNGLKKYSQADDVYNFDR